MRRFMLIAVLALLVLPGCGKLFKDRTTTEAASVTLSSDREAKWVYHDGKWQPVLKESKAASAVGPAIDTSQDGGTQDFDATCPEVSLNGLFGSGGGLGFSVKNVWQRVLRGPGLMVGGGILLILAAGAIFFFTRDVWAAAVVGVGGLIVCAAGVLFETYPWVLLLIAAVVVGVAIYFVYQIYRKKMAERESKSQSLVASTLVRSIEMNPDAKAAIVKTVPAVAGANQTEVKRVVTEIKKREGI